MTPKTGKQIELISYHFDHKAKRSILGNQCVQLGYHNDINFFPLDIAFHTSKNRPNTRMRDIDKRTNGWLRRKEAVRKKTDVVLEMIARAWQNNIDASFVLFDSWFSHDAVIAKILDIGYGVICRLKQGRVKYTYKGKKYTLKQLWPIVKKQAQWLSRFQVKAVCVNVSLPNSRDVRILYLMLVFILNRNDLQGPFGPLFKKISDNNLYMCVTAKMWNRIKDLMITSSDLICYQIEPNTIMISTT